MPRHAAQTARSHVLWTVLALTAAVAWLSPSLAAAGKACSATSFEFDAVKKACDKDGQKGAKALMKATIKKANVKLKNEGKPKLKCKGCHENLKDFSLKDNAVDDLRPWM